MRRSLNRLIDHRGGATAIEYALIAACISLVVIAAVTATGQVLWNTLSNVSTAIQPH